LHRWPAVRRLGARRAFGRAAWEKPSAAPGVLSKRKDGLLDNDVREAAAGGPQPEARDRTKKRLADAERTLAIKEIKTASESKRIAATKITQPLQKLALVSANRPHANDYRIFPRNYAAYILVPDGEQVLVPARYLLRQPGGSPFMDDKLSGNYNAMAYPARQVGQMQRAILSERQSQFCRPEYRAAISRHHSSGVQLHVTIEIQAE
jgi:hypothetical protein